MQIFDKSVAVKRSGGDTYGFEINGVLYTVEQGVLEGKMAGGIDVLELFLNNLAVRLSLSGIDPTDEAAVIAEIQKSKFKLPG